MSSPQLSTLRKIFRRFACTPTQKLILQNQLDTLSAHMQREAHHRRLAERRALGDRLMQLQDPQARLDYSLSRIFTAVDRVMTDPAILPDAGAGYPWREL